MQIIKTKTEDGLKYSGILTTPSTPSKNLILHVHGMAGDIYSNSFYPAMYANYPKNDWAFLAVEHRGTHAITEFTQNDSDVNIGNAYEVFEDSAKDIRAWVNTAKELGFSNIWLQSHSLGPSKVTHFVHTTKPTDIAGLIFLSPSDMMGLVHEPEGYKDHQILLPEAQQLVAQGKGDQLLSHLLWKSVKISAKTYINFFGDNANTAVFNYQNQSLGWDKVNAITLPVIAFTGTNDNGIVPIMDAYQAMQLLETELKNAPRKQTIVFEDGDHDFSGFGEKIVEQVLSFISK
jgi:hypothetical protein